METFFSIPFTSVHFVGIGGISMSALALYLKARGVRVTGSDAKMPPKDLGLSRHKIRVYVGHKKENLPFGVSAVIKTSAVADDNPEIKEAVKRGVPVFSRSELLGEILYRFPVSVGVSGTHGKTTTTAMLCEILARYKGVTAFIGGTDKILTNFSSTSRFYAVAEACEYAKNFLSLSPTHAVALNADFDHPDSYSSLIEVRLAFFAFLDKAKTTFVNADDPVLSGYPATVTFGKKKDPLPDYAFCNVKTREKSTRFTVLCKGKRLGRFRIPKRGVNFVYDALAAVAVANELHIPMRTVRSSLFKYSGVARRAEFLGAFALTGTGKKTAFYSDYAHHPKEIKSATDELLSGKTGKTLVLFQPHTFSRTKALKSDFARALSLPCSVGLFPTYPAREPFDKDGSALTLYRALKSQRKPENVLLFLSPEEVLTAAKAYDTVILLGAGDLPERVRKLLKKKK